MKEITERENFFLVYNHQKPAWTPNFFEAYAPMGCSLLNNTGEYMKGGTDMFGVKWLCTEDTGWQPIPDPHFQLIDDITEWKKTRDWVPTGMLNMALKMVVETVMYLLPQYIRWDYC